MVFDADAPSSAPRADPARFPIVTLGLDDVPDMLDLVDRTEPGPFTPKTIELGTYLGVRVDGALIAMAGERMRPPGYTEVSAVCTDPAFRGQGLAAYLVDAVMDLDPGARRPPDAARGRPQRRCDPALRAPRVPALARRGRDDCCARRPEPPRTHNAA